MLKLWCVLVDNDGDKFSVQADDSTTVEDVKKMIIAMHNYMKRASITLFNMKLFLAKKNGEWLDRAGAVEVDLDDDGKLQHFEWMDPELRVTDERYFGKHFQPEEGQIHVLVVIPRHSVEDPRVVHLQERFLRHTLMDKLSSTSEQSGDFKSNLITTYQCDLGTRQNNRMLRCMLLDTAIPSELIIASHLFRRKNAFLTRALMNFGNIDDVQNGLLLFKPLKTAFDHLRISFIYDKDSDEFRMKVFDPSLHTQRLFTMLEPDQQNLLLRGENLPKKWRKRGPRCAPETTFDIQTTFGGLEGKALRFLSEERPYKKCLNLQARVARKMAIEKKWIGLDEYDFEDFWAGRMSLAEKMDFFSPCW